MRFRIYLSVVVFLFGINHRINAQSSWQTKESEKLAKKYWESKKTQDDFFVINSEETRFRFEIDSETDLPVAYQETTVEVLSFFDYAKFKTSVYTDSFKTVNGIYGIYETGSKYQILSFTRDYQSSGVFHQDGEYVYFQLGESTYGEVQKFTYTIKHTDLKYLTNHYFQDNYHKVNSTLVIEKPDWLDMELVDMNLEGYGIKRTESKTDPTIEKPKTAAKKKKGEVEEVEKKDVTYIVYKVANLDAWPNENHSPGPSHYLPHIVFLFKEAKHEDYSARMLKEPVDLYRWYKSLLDQVENDSVEIRALYDKITANSKSKEDKLTDIFYWLQENIRYIAFEDGIAGFKPESASNVCKNRYGDCKGMAHLAKELYKMGGFDARLTWIGTSRIAYDYRLPNLAVDNHAICTVIDGEKRYFIDVTEEFVSIGDYANRIQGRPVMIENGDSFLIDTIPKFDSEHNRVDFVKVFTLQGNEIVGSASEIYNGEGKIDILRSYNAISSHEKDDAIRKFLDNDDKDMDISRISHSDLSDRAKSLEFKYDFRIRNRIINQGNLYFIPIDLDQLFYYFFFDSKRITDYVFDSKYFNNSSYTFLVPDGFRIAGIPDNYSVNKKYYSLSVKVRQEGNKVYFERTINVKKGIIPKSTQEEWNTDLAGLRKVYDQFLIIEKN